MLPDVRFFVGAIVVAALLGVAGLGVFVSVRLLPQSKVGPLEASRNLAFTDNSEWNQFYEPGSVRRFVGLARQAKTTEAADTAPDRHAEEAAQPPAVLALRPAETPQSGDGTETSPTPAATSASVDKAGQPVPTIEAVPPPATPAVPDTPQETAVLESPSVPAVPVLTANAAPASGRAGIAEAPAAPVLSRPAPAEPAVMDNAGIGSVPVAPLAAPETGAQEPEQSPQPAAAPPPRPALAKASAPPARRAAPAPKHAAPEPEEEPPRKRAASTPRARPVVSRQRYAPQAYGQQQQQQQQYAHPQAAPQFTGQPQFGPYFPYGSRPPSAQRSRTQQYGAPAYDPRQFAPPSYAQPRQPARQSFNTPYGWR